MSKKILSLITVMLLVSVIVPFIVFAHGTTITYTTESTYSFTATHDDGTALSEAQVIIFAPSNPEEPWKKDICDLEGKFSFSPDSSIEGTWTVQFRKAGHGDMVSFEVGNRNNHGNGNPVSGGPNAFTVAQKIIMALCVVWGLVGTALYFSGRSKK